MVTHDQEEALATADRIVVMNGGKIEQVGTPLEVYRKPTTLFVADFIGETNKYPVVVGNEGAVGVGRFSLHCHEHDLPAGSEAVAVIRPNDIVPHGRLIDDRSFAENGENLIEVQIESMEFWDHSGARTCAVLIFRTSL